MIAKDAQPPLPCKQVFLVYKLCILRLHVPLKTLGTQGGDRERISAVPVGENELLYPKRIVVNV